jgi:predicted ATPase
LWKFEITKMDYIEIRGYKSIKEAKIALHPINILIGANGSGKTNFLSFFEFLYHLYERKLTEYIALNGGEDKMLHHGAKVTESMEAYISFKNEISAYSFQLLRGVDGLIFKNEVLAFHEAHFDIGEFGKEATIKYSNRFHANYIRSYLEGLKKYHFHDTGKNSPFNKQSHIIKDIFLLYEKGDNLAAFLYKIHKNHIIVYNRIVKTIQSIAPYFSDFYLEPNTEGYLRLLWQDKYSSNIYGATDLSDGTIRFIALTTLFLQPNLPNTIIIDEPELGLHPFALSKLAGMIKSAAAKGAQVIVATQSTDLLSYFTPDDIIAVDQRVGSTVFNRLKEADLEIWLNDYALGELWKRSIIKEGQP